MNFPDGALGTLPSRSKWICTGESRVASNAAVVHGLMLGATAACGARRQCPVGPKISGCINMGNGILRMVHSLSDRHSSGGFISRDQQGTQGPVS